MARRLILDTGVLIAAERGRARLGEVIGADDDVALAAVTVAELRTGIELASDLHRRRRTDFLSQILQTIPVQPYDLEEAQAHGRLLAHVQRAGRPRGAHDLIIAATAVTTGRVVVSGDARTRFGDLPGVECLTLP